VRKVYVAIIADLKGMSRDFLKNSRPKNQGDCINDFGLKALGCLRN
jgi:hypothetical protein